MLPRAVESVLAQDLRDLRLLISDNASTDGTRDYCLAIRDRDPRVEYVRHASHVTAHANFRFGLDTARTDLFMWLGDDDWLGERYLSRCVEELDKDPALLAVAGAARYFHEGRAVFEGENIAATQPMPRARVVSYFEQVFNNHIFYGLARRSAFLGVEIGEGLAMDWLVMARIAFHGSLRTLDGVWINRGSQGESQDLAAHARNLGLPPSVVRNPGAAIAWLAFVDVAWRSRTYRALPPLDRLSLALVVRSVIRKKFRISRWHNLQYALRAKLRLRSRARAVLARVRGAASK